MLRSAYTRRCLTASQTTGLRYRLAPVSALICAFSRCKSAARGSLIASQRSVSGSARSVRPPQRSMGRTARCMSGSARLVSASGRCVRDPRRCVGTTAKSAEAIAWFVHASKSSTAAIQDADLPSRRFGKATIWASMVRLVLHPEATHLAFQNSENYPALSLCGQAYRSILFHQPETRSACRWRGW